MTPTKNIVLIVNGTIFLLLGICFVLNAEELFASIGVSTTSFDGLNELRSLYGGGEIGIGLFLILCGLRLELNYAGALLLATLISAILSSRLLGAISASEFSNYTLFALAVELLMLTSAVLLLRNNSLPNKKAEDPQSGPSA